MSKLKELPLPEGKDEHVLKDEIIKLSNRRYKGRISGKIEASCSL